jgi:hypothetical protein
MHVLHRNELGSATNVGTSWWWCATFVMGIWWKWEWLQAHCCNHPIKRRSTCEPSNRADEQVCMYLASWDSEPRLSAHSPEDWSWCILLVGLAGGMQQGGSSRKLCGPTTLNGCLVPRVPTGYSGLHKYCHCPLLKKTSSVPSPLYQFM